MDVFGSLKASSDLCTGDASLRGVEGSGAARLEAAAARLMDDLDEVPLLVGCRVFGCLRNVCFLVYKDVRWVFSFLLSFKCT